MRRILVAEHNNAIREGLVTALTDEYHMFGVSDGEEAIRYLEHQRCDLITLELNMPITGGWEALRIIKDPDNGWFDMKVIILTVNREPENVLKAWNLGANYYITKPFSIGQVRGTIRKCLEPVPL